MTDTDYAAEDFKEVYPGAGVFFCPGCNASSDDADMSSGGCPCDTHGTGFGSLDTEGLEQYLND